MTNPSNLELKILVPGVQPGETDEEFARRVVADFRKAGLFEHGDRSRLRIDETEARLAPRVDPSNPDHHLWNNNGTWWFHCTVHEDDYTSRRVRRSLGTRDVEEARRRRDDLLGGKGGREQ